MMNNKYTDYQIMSPEIMEQISKAYNSKLKEQKNNIVLSLENISNSLKKIQYYLTEIEKFCSYRFYKNNVIKINSIKSVLQDLIDNINYNNKINHELKFSNYCQIIKECLFELETALNCSNKLLYTFNEDLLELNSKLIRLITPITNLFVNCKYRYC